MELGLAGRGSHGWETLNANLFSASHFIDEETKTQCNLISYLGSSGQGVAAGPGQSTHPQTTFCCDKLPIALTKEELDSLKTESYLLGNKK